MKRYKREKTVNSSKNKKSAVKKILIAVIIIASAMVALDIIIANVLINYVLVDAVNSDMDVSPESIVSEELQKKITENRMKSDTETDIWYKSVDVQNVSIVSNDGFNLYADLFENQVPSHNWSICIHGYVGNRAQLRFAAQFYYEKGYNVLAPDLRAHGESEGTYIGMGWLDRKDILRWIDLIIKRDPEAKIVLHGSSMGAATVMMTIGEEAVPSNVVAAVEDCGYTSVWDVFSDEARNYFHIPDFPILHTASLFTKLRAGYGFKEASSIAQIKKTQIPVMFIHGSADNFVDIGMVYELYETCPTSKKKYVAEGAGHGESYYLDMDRYKEEIADFLSEYL